MTTGENPNSRVDIEITGDTLRNRETEALGLCCLERDLWEVELKRLGLRRRWEAYRTENLPDGQPTLERELFPVPDEIEPDPIIALETDAFTGSAQRTFLAIIDALALRRRDKDAAKDIVNFLGFTSALDRGWKRPRLISGCLADYVFSESPEFMQYLVRNTETKGVFSLLRRGIKTNESESTVPLGLDVLHQFCDHPIILLKLREFTQTIERYNPDGSITSEEGEQLSGYSLKDIRHEWGHAFYYYVLGCVNINNKSSTGYVTGADAIFLAQEIFLHSSAGLLLPPVQVEKRLLSKGSKKASGDNSTGHGDDSIPYNYSGVKSIPTPRNISTAFRIWGYDPLTLRVEGYREYVT